MMQAAHRKGPLCGEVIEEVKASSCFSCTYLHSCLNLQSSGTHVYFNKIYITSWACLCNGAAEHSDVGISRCFVAMYPSPRLEAHLKLQGPNCRAS